MVEVIGVRFRQAGRIYLFNPKNIDFQVGDHCIAETARGVEYGTVVTPKRSIDEKKVKGGHLKAIQRKADERDAKRVAENAEKSKEAFAICKQKIKNHKLDMKLVGCEYTFDRNKVLFYFTADGRVDFRELVKDLATTFRTRIELRQIGVRDEAKLVGGIGVCGREFCCHSHLADFSPSSIKMAKEQGLSLNPTKISGMCGRLMCCLNNEEATYEYLNERLPNVGDNVTTPTGQEGKVNDVNVLRQTVQVLIESSDGEKELLDFDVADLKFKPRKNKNNKRRNNNRREQENANDIRQLEEMEKKEKTESKSKLNEED